MPHSLAVVKVLFSLSLLLASSFSTQLLIFDHQSTFIKLFLALLFVIQSLLFSSVLLVRFISVALDAFIQDSFFLL